MAVALRDARRHDVLDAERLEAALLLDGARRPRHADARLHDGDGVVVALLHGLDGALLDDDVARPPRRRGSSSMARRRLDAVRVERLLLAAALLGVGALHLGVGAMRLDAMRVDALLGIGAAIIGAAAGVGIDGLRLASGEYLAGGLMAARRRRDVVDDGLDGHVVVVGRRRHDALRDERLRRLLDEGQDRRRGHERRDGRRGDDRPR